VLLEKSIDFYIYFFLILFFVICFPISVTFADDVPELVTDRPDQTESCNILPPKYIQIESGIIYTRIDDYDITEALGTLVRIGLFDKLEVRFGFDGWIIDDIMDTEGFGDSKIEVKYWLCEQDGWIPQSALLASVCIPTAKNVFEGKRFDPELHCSCRATSVRWAGSYSLTDYLSLGMNLAASWECEKDANGNRHMNAILPYSASLGITFTDRLGGFIEFFGGTPASPTGKPSNLIDGGFTYLARDNFQFDIAGGVGMTESAEDWFLGTGVSYRFPR
jgi:hypothetical protein